MLSPGQRFMTDLLVSSLMADGGLEIALDATFKKETQDMEELKVRHQAYEEMVICRHCMLAMIKNHNHWI